MLICRDMLEYSGPFPGASVEGSCSRYLFEDSGEWTRQAGKQSSTSSWDGREKWRRVEGHRRKNPIQQELHPEVPRQNVRRQNVRRQNVRWQNVQRQKVRRQNVRRQNFRRPNVRRQTSVGKNVRRDKTSGGKNVRWDKTSGGAKRPGGQNVRRDKMSAGIKKTSGKEKSPPLWSVGEISYNVRGKKRPAGEKTPGKEISPRFPNSHNFILLLLLAILFYNNYFL